MYVQRKRKIINDFSTTTNILEYVSVHILKTNTSRTRLKTWPTLWADGGVQVRRDCPETQSHTGFLLLIPMKVHATLCGSLTCPLLCRQIGLTLHIILSTFGPRPLHDLGERGSILGRQRAYCFPDRKCSSKRLQRKVLCCRRGVGVGK